MNAVTDVEGNGENADIDQTTIVKSDKDIDVVQYVKRYDNGHDVYTIAGGRTLPFEVLLNSAL